MEVFTFFSGVSPDAANEEAWGWSYKEAVAHIQNPNYFWPLPGVRDEAQAAVPVLEGHIGSLGSEDDGTHFPLLPAAVAATLGPLALLAGAAFAWRRKGGAG
jgi:hypothetical protein